MKKIRIENKIHYSLQEVATYASSVSKRSYRTERDKIYRLAGSNSLPILKAFGEQRVKQNDLIKYIGLNYDDVFFY